MDFNLLITIDLQVFGRPGMEQLYSVWQAAYTLNDLPFLLSIPDDRSNSFFGKHRWTRMLFSHTHTCCDGVLSFVLTTFHGLWALPVSYSLCIDSTPSSYGFIETTYSFEKNEEPGLLSSKSISSLHVTEPLMGKAKELKVSNVLDNHLTPEEVEIIFSCRLSTILKWPLSLQVQHWMHNYMIDDW